MPADIRNIAGKGGFSTYERCFTEVSCHAADLTYTFDTARRINCNDEGKTPKNGNGIFFYLGLRRDVFIYCEDDGRIYPEEQEYMTRSMKRYWANFARNANPNDDSGAHYPLGKTTQEIGNVIYFQMSMVIRTIQAHWKNSLYGNHSSKTRVGC